MKRKLKLLFLISITIFSLNITIFKKDIDIGQSPIISNSENFVINYIEIYEGESSDLDDKEKEVLKNFVNRLGCQYSNLGDNNYDFSCNIDTRAIQNPYNYELENVLIILPNKKKLLIPKLSPFEEKTYAICLKDYEYCFTSSKFELSDDLDIQPCYKIEINDWFSLKDMSGKLQLIELEC